MAYREALGCCIATHYNVKVALVHVRHQVQPLNIGVRHLQGVNGVVGGGLWAGSQFGLEESSHLVKDRRLLQGLGMRHVPTSTSGWQTRRVNTHSQCGSCWRHMR